MTAKRSCEQVRSLREALQKHYPGPFEITYAAKAYFSLGMARHLAGMDLGVDVVSLGELAVARRAGFAPERVHLHGNNKSIEELAAALEWGVQAIVVDSLEELETLDCMAAEARKKVRIWLRVSPGVKVDSHSYLQTAHHTSKFGLTTEGGPAASAKVRSGGLKPAVAASDRAAHAPGLADFRAGAVPRGGRPAGGAGRRNRVCARRTQPGRRMGCAVSSRAAASDPADWIRAVSEAVQAEFGKRGWPLPRLVVEPGRWLVARAGMALYSVGTTKTAGDGTRFVAVDGGMADNPRPALYQARYTACLAERPDAQPVQKVNLVGRFCESGDQLIPELWLPEVQRGDLLVMPVAGAYQLSMASNYNLAPRPAVLWLEDGQAEVLQPRERLLENDWWAGDL